MHNEINQKIQKRLLFEGNDVDTYYTEALYGFACNNWTDPLVLFKLKIYGYYKLKYKWTQEQADWFIENNIHEATFWSDGIREYYYDWGIGKNQITKHNFHFPHLDHKNVASQSHDNRPENMRIRAHRLNEAKGDINSDKERWAVGIDNFKDMGLDTQDKFIIYLVSIKKSNNHLSNLNEDFDN
jgi:hypothetical protein